MRFGKRWPVQERYGRKGSVTMLIQMLTLILLLGLSGFMPAGGTPSQPLPAAAESRAPGAAPSPREGRIEHDLKQMVARVQPMLQRYGYPALFLAVLVEGMGIPAPGQTLLIAAALIAAHGNLNIVWVLIWSCLAAMLGNILGYLIGRWGGRPLLARFKVRGGSPGEPGRTFPALWRGRGSGGPLFRCPAAAQRHCRRDVGHALESFRRVQPPGGCAVDRSVGLRGLLVRQGNQHGPQRFPPDRAIRGGFNAGGIPGVDGFSVSPPLDSKAELTG